MKIFESGNKQNPGAMLIELKKNEEAYRLALEQADKPMAEGGATEPVIEDLQTRYFLAKQEREDFERNHSH